MYLYGKLIICIIRNNGTDNNMTELLTETEDQVDLRTNEGASSVMKRPVKMTEKAILAKVENLQKERKGCFKKMDNLKKVMIDLMYEKGFVKEVRNTV